jgi:cell pole-organizing protein PopZ
MSQPAKAQEPSMEEILASIRRIIADDEAKTPESKPVENKPAESKAVEAPVAVMEPRRTPEPPRPSPVQAPPKPAPVAATAPPAPPAPKQASTPPVTNARGELDSVFADLEEVSSEPLPVPEPDNDVLELTEAMARPAPPPPASSAFRTVHPSNDVEFLETRADQPPPQMEAVRPLMSAATMSAVDSAFNSLANTVLAGNARTLEDLVREMLRPMLKSWLDDNLPGMVERIVRAEIERVSRGR